MATRRWCSAKPRQQGAIRTGPAGPVFLRPRHGPRPTPASKMAVKYVAVRNSDIFITRGLATTGAPAHSSKEARRDGRPALRLPNTSRSRDGAACGFYRGGRAPSALRGRNQCGCRRGRSVASESMLFTKFFKFAKIGFHKNPSPCWKRKFSIFNNLAQALL